MDSQTQTDLPHPSAPLSQSLGFALGFVSGVALYCLLTDDRQSQFKNQLVKLYRQFGSESQEAIDAFRQYVDKVSHHYSDEPDENLHLAGLLPFIPQENSGTSSISTIERFFSRLKNLTSTSPLIPTKKNSSKNPSSNSKKYFNRSHR